MDFRAFADFTMFKICSLVMQVHPTRWNSLRCGKSWATRVIPSADNLEQPWRERYDRFWQFLAMDDRPEKTNENILSASSKNSSRNENSPSSPRAEPWRLSVSSFKHGTEKAEPEIWVHLVVRALSSLQPFTMCSRPESVTREQFARYKSESPLQLFPRVWKNKQYTLSSQLSKNNLWVDKPQEVYLRWDPHWAEEWSTLAKEQQLEFFQKHPQKSQTE